MAAITAVSPIRRMMVDIQNSLDASERLDANAKPDRASAFVEEHQRHWSRRIEHLGASVMAEVPTSLADVLGILNCATTMMDRFDAFADMEKWEQDAITESVKIAIEHCIPLLTDCAVRENPSEVQLTRNEMDEALRVTRIAQQREGR